MFSWEPKRNRSRFSTILLGSVLLHAGAVAAIYGVYTYRGALKFGALGLDDDPTYAARFRVASAKNLKPLVLPPSFYAQKKVKSLEEMRKAEARKPRPERRVEEKRKKEPVEEAPAAETASADPTPEPAPPSTGPPRFGRIKESALKVHLKAIYAEYEKGRLPDGPFRVSVTCKVQPDGSLSNISIAKSSGNAMIDETALNLFREVSEMRALQPLSMLTSLSLTLEKGETSSTISAVGFSGNAAQAEDLARELNNQMSWAKLLARNKDQAALLRQVSITQTGPRLSVSIGMPNSRAGEMMRNSFGTKPTPPAPAKATA